MSLLLVQADARHLPFADGSVQTCVTSPPYWNLRDYNNAGQLGLESTPDAYVQNMVAVFREVWRVLREDGTCWLNLGDSYASQGGATPGRTASSSLTTRANGSRKYTEANVPARTAPAGLKPKDLVGIPWSVAFSLRADGWYLRSDIVWEKPSCMPESVIDRPTRSHEYVFLLSKRQQYFFDAAAISEPVSDAMLVQLTDGYDGVGQKDYASAGVQNPSDVKSRIIGNSRKRADRFGGNKHDGSTTKHSDGSVYTGRPTRNARTVWRINPQPYPGAHFATMPEALARRCIMAGSRAGDIVLDPFLGSGTVARVALRLGRKAIGCDLNPAYLKLADDRTRVTYGLPLEVA